MDPLSITVSVATLLGACVKLSFALKTFHDAVTVVDAKASGLLQDVDSFARVLEFVRDTLEDEKMNQVIQSTGHIGDHWRNLFICINDGLRTLEALNSTLEGVNKSVTFLDSTRKHLRLTSAAEEIGMYQQQIRSYRDTIQLSIQTVILWNQVSFQSSTERILPSLDELSQSIRRLAIDVNEKMGLLQNTVESHTTTEQLRTLHNMKKCMQTATDVVSSASTVLVGKDDQSSVIATSDFIDIFPRDPSEPMLRWIAEKSSCGYLESSVGEAKSRVSFDDSSTPMTMAIPGDSDSDGEIDAEIVQLQLEKGKQALQSGNLHTAERVLRSGLLRLRTRSSRFLKIELKLEVLQRLLDTYLQQGDWEKAKKAILDRLALLPEDTPNNVSRHLEETLELVRVLLKMNDTIQGRMYARKCVKGYRKLGVDGRLGLESSLKTMIEICAMDGDVEEEEAYKMMLGNLLDQSAYDMETRLHAGHSQDHQQATKMDIIYEEPPSHLTPRIKEERIDRPHQGPDDMVDASCRERTSPDFSTYALKKIADEARELGYYSSRSLANEIQNFQIEENERPRQFIVDSASRGCPEERLPDSITPFTVPNIPEFPLLHGPFSWEIANEDVLDIMTESNDSASSKHSSGGILSTVEEQVPHKYPRAFQFKPWKDHGYRHDSNSQIWEPGSNVLPTKDEESSGTRTEIGLGGRESDSIRPQSLDFYRSSADSALRLSWNYDPISRVDGPRFGHRRECIHSVQSLPVLQDPLENHHRYNERFQSHIDNLRQLLPPSRNPELSYASANGGASSNEMSGEDGEGRSSQHSKLVSTIFPRISVLLLGGSCTGKTSLIRRFINVPSPLVSMSDITRSLTPYTTSITTIPSLEGGVELVVWDTPGSDEIATILQSDVIKGVDCIILCFAISEPDLTPDVDDVWKSAIQKSLPGKPIILAALKTDLRSDPVTVKRLAWTMDQPCSVAECVRIKDRIQAAKYVDCSSMTGEGVDDLFREAVTTGLESKNQLERKRSFWGFKRLSGRRYKIA